MFIKNCLTDKRQLTVIHPGETVSDVLSKMAQHLSLPCVAVDGTFLGMVSKRTIFEAFQRAVERGTPYDAFIEGPIDDAIHRDVPTLPLDGQFERALDIIIRHPFVPIVEQGQFVGIVKRSDVNDALSVAFATHVPADRLLLGLAEVEGSLERLFNVTHRLGINVITAVPFDAGDTLNRRLILKVTQSGKLDTLIFNLEKAGFLVIEVGA